jgi:hypothetical protein
VSEIIEKTTKPIWCIYDKLGFILYKPISFSWLERLYSHLGNEKRPTVGSSEEYWSMNESLNQRFVEMKGS